MIVCVCLCVLERGSEGVRSQRGQSEEHWEVFSFPSKHLTCSEGNFRHAMPFNLKFVKDIICLNGCVIFERNYAR